MLGSAFCYSFIPLVIAWSGGGDEPFLFSVVWRLGVSAGYVAFLCLVYWDLVTDRRVLALVLRRSWSFWILLVVASNFEIVLYVASTRFIDVSVAAVLFELGPILEIILMDRVLRTSEVYRAVRPLTLLMVVFCFVGVAFLVAGQHGGFVLWNSSSGDSLVDLGVGVGLAILGVVALSFVAFGFRWGFGLRDELRGLGLPGLGEDERSNFSLSLFCIVVAFLVGNLVSIPVNAAIGFSVGEGLALASFGIVVLGGVLFNAVGSILARVALLQTDDLGVNAIGYVTPVLALVWLFAFSRIGVARVDYLYIGAAAIVAANLLISYEAEIRLGFKSIVVSLWACGVFVYLREDWLGSLFPGGWRWLGDSYFDALAVSATVFTLLLSFRVVRLAGRTRDEDRLIFDLSKRFEVLVSSGMVDARVLERFVKVDGARTTDELQCAYREVDIELSRVQRESLGIEDLRYLVETESKLNDLVYSRHQGVGFGELFALMVFGFATVLLALVSSPLVGGWTALLVDFLSVLFSAVIIFLLVDVFDLQRDRHDRILGEVSDLGRFGVSFRDSKNRSVEQWVSVGGGLAIGALFFGLLWSDRIA